MLELDAKSASDVDELYFRSGRFSSGGFAGIVCRVSLGWTLTRSRAA